jgi:hypothetical protein
LLIPNREAIKLLGIGKTQYYELLRDGIIEGVRVGKRSRPVTAASIRKIVQNGGIQRAAPRPHGRPRKQPATGPEA